MHPDNPAAAAAAVVHIVVDDEAALIQISAILRLFSRLAVRLLGLLRRLVRRHELDDDDEELRVGFLVLQRISERVRAG
jgi:hypothetical protein